MGRKETVGRSRAHVSGSREVEFPSRIGRSNMGRLIVRTDTIAAELKFPGPTLVHSSPPSKTPK